MANGKRQRIGFEFGMLNLDKYGNDVSLKRFIGLHHQNVKSPNYQQPAFTLFLFSAIEEEKIAESEIPVVLYESPHRILKLLKELEGSSRVTIARELTKMHEEIVAGTPQEVLTHFDTHSDTVRGEFVVIVAPK